MQDKASYILIVAAALCMMAAVGNSGCAAVGIPDPDVTMPALALSETMLLVHDFADDQEQASRFLGMARLKLGTIPTEKMSELDVEKVTRLGAGITDLLAEIADIPYVRQRARSLAVLAVSLGQYEDSEALAEFVRVLEEERGDADAGDNTEEGSGG